MAQFILFVQRTKDVLRPCNVPKIYSKSQCEWAPYAREALDFVSETLILWYP